MEISPNKNSLSPLCEDGWSVPTVDRVAVVTIVENFYHSFFPLHNTVPLVVGFFQGRFSK